MFKVIIADNEAKDREYLHNIIDWKSYGFEICGEARNGLEAWEAALNSEPDIAFIEINMPIMDGLSLSEKLKEQNGEIIIILVTGYNKFDYVKKAIKIGIEDYILKPFDENELVAALLKAKRKLQKQRDIKELKKNNFYITRERVLNFLWKYGNSLSVEEITKQLERVNITPKGYSFIVSTIEIDNLFQKWLNVNKIIESNYTVSGIINNKLKLNGKHIAFNRSQNRIISIVGFDNTAEIEAFRPELYQTVCDFIMKHLGFTVTVGVGTVVNGLKSIRDSYLKSLDVLRNKSLYGNSKVIIYSENRSGPLDLRFYPGVIYEKLTMYLRLSDFDSIKEELDKVFNYYMKNIHSPDYYDSIIMGLISVCLAYISEMDKNIEDVLGIDFSPMQVVNTRISIEFTGKLIIELYERTINFFTHSKFTKTRKHAEIVKQYIDNNYMDTELNLKTISNTLFLNPDYLRRVFKKELNITLTDYIIALRMRKAKELINRGYTKFSNLCYEIGINDPSYFSKCFKKYYGLSPREYESLKM